ncbi:MAG: glucose-6-phosphate dehydrogenase [Kiritimatiellae bacterium]|nr:glucose-6-phosphate dehydrogenase [Kiritimatiellia bacterium]
MPKAELRYDCVSGLCVDTLPGRCGVVIFGASGDLTHRKLMPALFSLARRGLLPERFFVVGCARTRMSDTAFRDKVRQALPATTPADRRLADRFLNACYYLPGNYDEPRTYRALSKRLTALHGRHKTGLNHFFYLAIPPALYGDVVAQLNRAGLVDQKSAGRPWRRVIVEKPIGRDLSSAMDLDRVLHQHLRENQIYRIDHYLGKETVQNILMFRFANLIFEPLWNQQYVDHVQITVAEAIGIEHRAGYFEQTGLLRDMFQNHMFQMLALVAMEPPASFDADRLRDEKTKLLRSIRPFPTDALDRHLVRGQYRQGRVDGQPVRGYRAEDGVHPQSRTETFVAAKILIDNWRWQGVPFYLRSGKRLPRRVSEIAIAFRRVPHSIFHPLAPQHLMPDTLVLNVQPEEGISLTIQAKCPGGKVCMMPLSMDFRYNQVFGGNPPEAYERLLLDCMLGDQTLFIRNDNVEVSWALLTPVLEAWEMAGRQPARGKLQGYRAGSWGPAAAHRLLARDGRKWRTPGNARPACVAGEARS